MKRLLSIIFLLLSVFAFAQKDEIFPKKPNPPRLMNDFTRTLTPEQVQALEHKLVAYNDSTSNQVAVVMIKTLDNKYEIDQLSLKILREWGVGTSKHNNGVVLLIVKDDRKVRIETGAGLEGAIPDVTAKHIINEDIVPNFRANNYYRGIDAATDHIIKAAAGEYKAPPPSGKKRRGGIISVIATIVLIAIFSSIGGRGGRGGGMMSRRGYRDVGTGWLIGSILSGMTGGGGRSGGGGWSGGGGGGGFGGFGGGSGGGGGASGSW